MKRKNGKHIVHIILAGILCLCFMGCNTNESLRTEELFYNIEGDKIRVVCLTLEGRQKAEIIIPPFIDGKKVAYFSVLRKSPVFTAYYTDMWSHELVRFYAPYTLLQIDGDSGSVISGQKIEAVFYPGNALFESEEFADRNWGRLFWRDSYVTIKTYNYLTETYPKHSYIENVHPANVAYLFNYENSPNDNYYFIDNVEGGSLVRNAPAPEREGYEFQGWYKDAACENAWDFDTDTTAETLYDENEKEVFAETKLYAKWQAK